MSLFASEGPFVCHLAGTDMDCREAAAYVALARELSQKAGDLLIRSVTEELPPAVAEVAEQVSSYTLDMAEQCAASVDRAFPEERRCPLCPLRDMCTRPPA